MIDRVAIAEDAYLNCFSRFASVQPQGVTLDRNGALHIFTGANLGMMNPTLVHDAGRIETAIDDAIAFHAANATPAWNLVTRAIDTDAAHPAAEARGFTSTSDLPMMLLDDIPDAAVRDDLTILRVTDYPGILDHYRACADAFGMDYPDIEPVVTKGMLDRGFIHFIGYAEGEPVATSMAALSSGAGGTCVGIYNVATLPSRRGKGFGTAMTAHAAAVGRDEWGAKTAFLQSSPVGYPVYRKMGYDEVARWHCWAPQED